MLWQTPLCTIHCGMMGLRGVRQREEKEFALHNKVRVCPFLEVTLVRAPGRSCGRVELSRGASATEPGDPLTEDVQVRWGGVRKGRNVWHAV